MHLAATLTLRRWASPTAQPHPVDGDYAERFWLPVIGPSSLWVLRWAARELHRHGGAFDVGADELALRVGLGVGSARQSPLRRSLKRLESFGLAQRLSESVVEFRTSVPTVSMRQLERLPVGLRREHREWPDAAA
ncbi:MAG: hypothetical protein R2704_17685 [Microthrixaceae bacterium]